MKKLFTQLTVTGLLCLLLNGKLLSQAPDTSTTQKLLQYIFNNIDKTQIPTGFLGEYGCPMLPMATFNGSLSDSNRIDIQLWRTLYFQLQTSYIGTATNPLPSITTANSVILNNSSATLPIPIPVLIGQYNSVLANAFSNNLLSYNSGLNQVFDVAGRPQSPYQFNNLFAACPNVNSTLNGISTFIYNNNSTWNNTGKGVSQLSIDFANGLGFQTLTPGRSVTVSYADTGTKRWTIKATLSDNTILQCYSVFYVLTASSSNTVVMNTVGQQYGVINSPDSYSYRGGSSTKHKLFPPTINYPDGGYIDIVYSNLNRTSTLRKPLLVIEGYDVYKVAPILTKYNQYTYTDFIDDIANSLPQYDFNHQLDDIAGYDLIFLTFDNGTADIRNNAALAADVIRWIDSTKVPNNNNGNIIEQNVVMGLSMGGLVARYALAKMTKAGENTGTRLLITHDSPHQGANVPLGLQYFIRMLGNFQLFGTNVTDIFPEYNQVIGLFTAPATQQLLIYTSTGTNTYAANTFLNNDYRNMITFAPTDPQPSYNFIATSLGSECAHPLFAPGKTFLNFGAGVSTGIDARVLFFRIPIVNYYLAASGEAYALPNNGTVAKLARVLAVNSLTLLGFINIYKQLYDNTAYSTGTETPFDGAPGSVYPILDLASLKQLQTIPTFNPVSISLYFPIGNFAGAYFDAYAYNQGFSYDFSFVPVASALDASPFNANTFSQPYVNGFNQSYPSTSKTFIAQETINPPSTANATNNAHIRFTARNAQWLYNQMENIPNSINCSSECAPTISISGVNSLCTSSTFQINGLNNGTVTWSSSPAGIVSISPIGNNGYQATVTATLSGYVTITATINPCGQTASTYIHVGGYGSSDYPVSGPSSVCTNQTNLAYNTNTLPGATNYTWFWPSDWTYAGGQGTPHLLLNAGSNVGGAQVGVRVANNCDAGGSPAIQFVQVNSCGFSFVASPNPSTGTTTITAKQPPTNGKAEKIEKIYQLRVLSSSGITRKQYDYPGGVTTTVINLADLAPGTYAIQAFNGSVWGSAQVIKQ